VSKVHVPEVTLTPPLDEGDGKGFYQLPEATCSCGWMGPSCSSVEVAQKWANEHASHKNVQNNF